MKPSVCVGVFNVQRLSFLCNKVACLCRGPFSAFSLLCLAEFTLVRSFRRPFPVYATGHRGFPGLDILSIHKVWGSDTGYRYQRDQINHTWFISYVCSLSYVTMVKTGRPHCSGIPMPKFSSCFKTMHLTKC